MEVVWVIDTAAKAVVSQDVSFVVSDTTVYNQIKYLD